jgi:hypothetical protein
MLDEVTCFHCDEARTYERPHAPDECNGIDWDAPSSEAEARFGDCVGKIDAAPQDRADGEHVALQKRDRHKRRDGVKGCLRTDVDETQQEREERSNVNCVDRRQVLGVDLKRRRLVIRPVRALSLAATYFANPRREWETVVSGKCPQITRYCGDVADVGEKNERNDQHKLYRHPLRGHALLQNVDDGICADVLQRRTSVWHCEAEH